MSNLPKGLDAWPTGVRKHGNKLRINFMFKGVRCQESIEGISNITKSAVMYAANKRSTIMTEIKENRFDYALHFPESSNAKLFSGWGGSDIKRTVAKGVERWLEVAQATHAKATYKGYYHKAQHVLNYFGDVRRIDAVTNSDLKLFRSHLLTEKEKKGAGLETKTVNDVFTVVRGVFNDAYEDGVIKNNPVQRIKNLKLPKHSEEADPFERHELTIFENATNIKEQLKNLVLFNCWAGLSVSEVMALAWEDVDFHNWTIKIQRARVNEEYKVPKEVSRERTIELIEPAIQFLKIQKALTFMLKPSDIKVKQRDNTKQLEQSVRFVFINEINDTPWHQASIGRAFATLSRLTGVRYRSPNQCRHTFASQCLSNYVPMEWLARQLGHSDTSMIKKHYARWIPSDTKSMAGMVSGMLGFSEDIKGHKTLENVPNSFQGGV